MHEVFSRLRGAKQLPMVIFGKHREEFMQLLYANVRSEKAKIARGRNLDKHSLEAVGILKQAMDKEDKYLIY